MIPLGKLKRLLFIALLVVFSCEDEQDTTGTVLPCSLNDVYINEVHGDGNPDWVEIYNAGVECSLIGFTLDDQETPDDFIFGDMILVAYGYWLGREDDENNFNFGIEKNGETLWLCYGTSNCQAFEVGNTENLTAWGYPNNDRSQLAGNLTQSTPGSANTD